MTHPKKDQNEQPEEFQQNPDRVESIGEDDVFSKLDSYQNQIESEWESAKSTYQSKINQILDEFIQDKMKGPEKDISIILPEPDKKTPKSRIEKALDKAEQALSMSGKKMRQLDYKPQGKPSVVNIDWSAPWERRPKRWPYVCLVLLLLGGLAGGIYWYQQVPVLSPLPYGHTGGLIVDGTQIIVVDWFRKSLYKHKAHRGLPLVSVENLPNEFLTGLALARGTYYSLDGFRAMILQHDNSPEHFVLNQTPAPSSQVTGLYFDGQDLWTFDEGRKKLVHFRGVDPTEIKEEYTALNLTPTAFIIHEGRAWMLDKKSRTIKVLRLEEPLRDLVQFDLDPFIKGASPSSLAIDKKYVWVTTENPSQLVKISPKKLREEATKLRF